MTVSFFIRQVKRGWKEFSFQPLFLLYPFLNNSAYFGSSYCRSHRLLSLLWEVLFPWIQNNRFFLFLRPVRCVPLSEKRSFFSALLHGYFYSFALFSPLPCPFGLGFASLFCCVPLFYGSRKSCICADAEPLCLSPSFFMPASAA